MNPAPCPTGFYCPSGTSAAQSFPCPAGTFGPDQYYTAIENCTDCPAGSYCERDGLDAATGECWAGYYCTGGASSPTPISHNVSLFVLVERLRLHLSEFICTDGASSPTPISHNVSLFVLVERLRLHPSAIIWVYLYWWSVFAYTYQP